MAAVTAMAGASIAGAAISARGARKGAASQAAAAEQAAQLQAEQFRQTRRDLAPFRQVGTQAIGTLADLSGLSAGGADFSSFERSPGFQFRLQQGEQAINRAAAARGRFDSGATLQDLGRFNQGLASQEFGAHFNRLSGLAGMGQNAAAQTGSFGAQSAANQGNALMAAGQARASGFTGQANAINQGLGNLSGVAGFASQRRSGFQVPADIMANQNALNAQFRGLPRF